MICSSCLTVRVLRAERNCVESIRCVFVDFESIGISRVFECAVTFGCVGGAVDDNIACAERGIVAAQVKCAVGKSFHRRPGVFSRQIVFGKFFGVRPNFRAVLRQADSSHLVSGTRRTFDNGKHRASFGRVKRRASRNVDNRLAVRCGDGGTTERESFRLVAD